MRQKILEAFKYYDRLNRFFHNETELVFYIAKHIIENSNIEANFEVPIKNNKNKTYKIDLVLTKEKKEYLVEFKFIRSKFVYQKDGHEFILIDGGTTDFYKAIVDIERLEDIQNNYENAYLVVLSNYKKSFNLENDKIKKQGTKLFPMTNTKLNSETTVTTNNYYEFNWEDYGRFNSGNNREFKYLILEIPPKKNER